MRPDFSTYPDHQLLGFLTGDDLHISQQAYEEIVNRYSGQMLEASYSVLQNKDSSKDCVQNVLLRIWQNRLQYKIENLPAYLNRSVRIECLQSLRSAKPVESLDERFVSITSRLQACDPLRYKELQALLDKVLASLPDVERNIFLLSRDHEMTYKEIAASLGISVKTVEKKMTNSLRHIRTHLNPSDNLATITLLSILLH